MWRKSWWEGVPTTPPFFSSNKEVFFWILLLVPILTKSTKWLIYLYNKRYVFPLPVFQLFV